ncbi:MAG: GlcG/HbpS family heme-binding protein [Burkholderiaceae bacterium]
MKIISTSTLIAALMSAVSLTAHGAEPSYSIKLMTPETALKAALASLEKCRKEGYQVAVAVVDRTGQTQVVLRDRFAGMHTPTAAVDKAWTAVSFRSNTSDFANATQAGKASSGIRFIPKTLAVGGGLMIEAGGSLYGAMGVSGAPSGEADDLCAKAGIEAVMEDLEL